ncbi:MAG: helix-turn-helix transcriptional regulator [Clostridia bacterium]|nr:helix-turn-helix transcriptional regulator [Clostridia bacterium]
MSIGRNIAEFRKKRGFTQEELGAQLGVTNQAVSKWENETTLPDVMLLPGIANALGVTLNALYGIEEEIPAKVRADDFPAAAKNMLTEYFIRQAGAFPANSGEPGDHIQLLGCISNTAGAVFVSRNFSFIENDLGTPGSERIFERGEAASALKKLADPDVRKVYAHLYRTVYARSEPCSVERDEIRAFTVPELASDCGMEEDAVLETLEKLQLLNLIEDDPWIRDDGTAEYYFNKHYAQFALAVFRAVDLLLSDLCYVLWRDTSKISDYLFETLWK